MRKKIIILFVLLVVLVAAVTTVSAITNGVPDGNNHPYVGLLVFDVDGGPAWRCSGSLIAPNVVLTAGHCTYGADGARVWFDEVVQGNPEYPLGGSTSIEGTPYYHPGYDYIPQNNGIKEFAAPTDVGIVVLDEAVDVGGFAALPPLDFVDTLPNNTPVDLVGYGVQEMNRGGGPPYWTGVRVRMYAPSKLVPSNSVVADTNIKLSMNVGQDKGGTCFGDSGGADFLAGTNTVLGVNSFVTNYNCAGVGYSTRVDTPEVLPWIQGFLSD